jgi:hypothetical protein
LLVFPVRRGNFEICVTGRRSNQLSYSATLYYVRRSWFFLAWLNRSWTTFTFSPAARLKVADE